MDRLLLIVLVVGAVSVGITLLIGKIVPKVKFLRYFPGVLCLIFSAYYFYLAEFVRAGQGFEDLANFMISIFLLAGALFGIITAFILGYLDRRRK